MRTLSQKTILLLSMRVCKSYHGTSRGLAKVRTFGFLRVFETFYIPLSAARRRATREHRINLTLKEQHCASRGCRTVYLEAGMEYI